MAFMLPFIGGVGGAIIGFAAGYNYSSADTHPPPRNDSQHFSESSKSISSISSGVSSPKSSLRTLEDSYVMSVGDLKDLKHKSPHKELRDEIVNFDTTALNKVELAPKKLSEPGMIKKIRENMKNRRSVIYPIT